MTDLAQMNPGGRKGVVPARSPLPERVLGAVGVGCAFVAMAWWTWNGWADPVRSFGREVYLPWQIATEGRILYRDLAHFQGPLSVYFNALVFTLFGATLRALTIANLVWLALLVALVFHLWRAIADTVAAVAACAMLVLLFGFVQFTREGSFNFVGPYSHELTHGLVISLGAIACLGAHLRGGGSTGWLAATGGLCGMVLLTRAEVFAAVFVPVCLGLVAGAYARRVPRRDLARQTVVFVSCASVPALVALLMLRIASDWQTAWDGISASWQWLLDERLTALPHLERVSGTDYPERNLDRAARFALGYLVLFVPPVLIGLLVRSRRSRSGAGPERGSDTPGAPARADSATAWAIGTALAILAILAILFDTIVWQYSASAAGWMVLGIALALGAALVHRGRAQIDSRLVLQMTVAWFALFMLARMGLRVVIFEYGFTVALPAVLVCVAALVTWVPRLVDRAGGSGLVPRVAAVAVLCVFAGQHLYRFHRSFADKRPTLRAGTANEVRTDRRGLVIQQILQELDARSKPGETLLVVPEGAMLNFLSRRPNPTPIVTFMPAEVLLIGNGHVMEAIDRAPADWVVEVLIESDHGGFKAFTAEWGRDVHRWIESRYDSVATYGNDEFAMRLMKRR